jgi:hypothetical protein
MVFTNQVGSLYWSSINFCDRSLRGNKFYRQANYMTNKVQDQANKVKETIFSPATADAYSAAIALTWTILKETAQLLWLVVCLGLVSGDWFWKKSYQTGQNARVWVDGLQQRQQAASTEDSAAENGPSIAEAITTGEFWSSTGKSLLDAGKTATAIALTTAKNQLGIEITEEPASASLPAPPTAPASPKPSTPAPVSTPPMPTASPTQDSATPNGTPDQM